MVLSNSGYNMYLLCPLYTQSTIDPFFPHSRWCLRIVAIICFFHVRTQSTIDPFFTHSRRCLLIVAIICIFHVNFLSALKKKKRVHLSFLGEAQTCKKESILYMQTTQIAWTMIWNEYETLHSYLSLFGRQTIKSKKWRFSVVAPVYRGIEPLNSPQPGIELWTPCLPGLTGRQSCHCAIESGLMPLSLVTIKGIIMLTMPDAYPFFAHSIWGSWTTAIFHIH